LLARCLIVLRRRFRWLLATALVVTALTFLVVRLVQPAYRATATLSFDEPVIQADLDSATLTLYARDRVAARHTEVLQRLEVDGILAGYASFADTRRTVTPAVRAAVLRDRATARVTDVTLVDGISDDLSLVSVIFSVSVEDPDRRVAAATLEALLALYAQADVDAATSELAQEITIVEAAIEQRSLAVRQLETTIAEFMQGNSSVLGETPDIDSRSAALAESELTQLEIQSQRLQDRSVTVGNALQGLDPRGALRREVSEPGPATPTRLAALQTMLAMLSGRYGTGHTDVQRLAVETQALRTELEREASMAAQELRTAQAEYERLQQLHPLDFPDVVRLANSVSSLAGAIDDKDSIGLSAGEIRYIEGLAREERELRAQLSEIQRARDETRARVADLQGRAARAPLLVQQYQALSENLTLAEASHAVALDDRRVLEYDYGILVKRDSPPVLLSEPPYVPEPVEATRTSTIVAAGLLLGVLCIGAVVVAVERIDRRVLGARSIVAINGKLPLAEIPIIPEPPFAPARVG
jgi:uncharacterized protein involved in exopolysaccharide biosynthesis